MEEGGCGCLFEIPGSLRCECLGGRQKPWLRGDIDQWKIDAR